MIAPRSLAPLLAVATLTLACGNRSRDVKSCASDPECPSGAYCVGGACVAGLLPEAHIRIAGVAGQLTSHRTILFDGSGSVDPNPQHRLTTYSWSLEQASAVGCDPTRKTGTGASLETMFPCAGDYHVELKVTNSLGLESGMTQAITVGPSANAPVVDGVSPGLVLDHRCAGAPLRCQAVGVGGATAFQLDVRAHDVEDGEALAYRWEVDAPPGADASAVTFDPSPTAQSPRISIASGGAGISGAWVLRALVSDGDGLTSHADVQVSVANTAPALALAGGAAAVELDHTFADHVYRVTGTVHLVAADAEGDALELPGTTLEESAATGCHFDVASTVPTADGFDVAVGMTCETAGALSPAIAGAAAGLGATRELVFSLRDRQGAATQLRVPFVVKDRPPAFVTPLVSTGHRTGSCLFPTGWCFIAEGSAPAAVDPDGDEVAVTAVERATDPRAIFSSTAAGFGVAIDGAYPSAFRTASGLHPIALVARVTDPWRTTALGFQLAIPNQPPVVTPEVLHPFVAFDGAQYVAAGVAASVIDPDGDPVALTTDASGCAGALSGSSLVASCTGSYAAKGVSALGLMIAQPQAVSGTASDPWAARTFKADVQPVAPPAPAVSPTREVSVGCKRTCPVGEPCFYVPTPGCVAVGFHPDIASTVPVSVQASAGGAPASFTCYAGTCGGSLSIQLCDAPATVTVSTFDGASSATVAVRVTKLACE